jgi:acetate---CoA ligase (ADP-forming)
MTVEELRGMRYFFQPKSIAVAGVSTDPSKIASIIFSNLQKNSKKGVLKASLYALNPTYTRIGEWPCYPSISALPEIPELLVVAIPASLTLQLITDAARGGVKAAVIITGGFAEVGHKRLQERIRQIAQRHGMRILGPNTIGVLDTISGLDMLFLPTKKTTASGKMVSSLVKPLKGGVVIITQSGHLGEVISEKLTANRVGLRALVGVGNQLDVSIEDVIAYFAGDERTKVVAVYFEGLKDGRRFLRLASESAKRKPIVVFKVGKTSAGAKAALTHTASLVGDYQTYQAASQQAGLLEAHDLQELIDNCISFALLRPASGRRVLIITNAGGVGAIATDEAERAGLEVRQPKKKTIERIKHTFSASGFIKIAALRNPMDLTANASTEEFVGVTELALGSEEYDMAVLLPTHQTPPIDYRISRQLAEVISRSKKPVSISVIGYSELAEIIQQEFVEKGIPSFPTPEAAVKVLAASAKYQELKSNVETLPKLSAKDKFAPVKRHHGRLSEDLSAKLLKNYGIEKASSLVVKSEGDVTKARGIAFPVACKLLSSQLLHKTEAGGVILNVRDENGLVSAFRRLRKLAVDDRLRFEGVLVQEMVEDGVETIVGGVRDETFGPVVLFGVGGIYTELVRDYATMVAPVSVRQARRMILGMKMSPLLNGYRNGPRVNLDELCRILTRFSRILPENPSIAEIEINPLIATEKRIVAVDTRVLLSPIRAK